MTCRSVYGLQKLGRKNSKNEKERTHWVPDTVIGDFIWRPTFFSFGLKSEIIDFRYWRLGALASWSDAFYFRCRIQSYSWNRKILLNDSFAAPISKHVFRQLIDPNIFRRLTSFNCVDRPRVGGGSVEASFFLFAIIGRTQGTSNI